MNGWSELLHTGRLFNAAFEEQRAGISSVYEIANRMLKVPVHTPAEYTVSMAPVPEDFYTLRKNVFSTLFQSMYHLMGCAPGHRLFYGKLLHLFRIWVTSADNLLDQEDKVVIPIQMLGSSRVMRQVVSIMTADRILQHLLTEEVAAGHLTRRDAEALSEQSLHILLPSAAQEASEEQGIVDRPDPEHVVSVIHRYKTGILFNVAFLAPRIVEPHLDPGRAQALEAALLKFGVGCQLLDDIRDMARDHLEHRHNYLLSQLWHHQPEFFNRLENRSLTPGDRLYLEALSMAVPAARRGLGMMRESLSTLGEMGLGIGTGTADRLATSMFHLLDLKDLNYA